MDINQHDRNRYSILTFGAGIIGVVITSIISFNSGYFKSQHDLDFILVMVIDTIFVVAILPSLLAFVYHLWLTETQEILRLQKNAKGPDYQAIEEYQIKITKYLALIITFFFPVVAYISLYLYLHPLLASDCNLNAWQSYDRIYRTIFIILRFLVAITILVNGVCQYCNVEYKLTSSLKKSESTIKTQ